MHWKNSAMKTTLVVKIQPCPFILHLLSFTFLTGLVNIEQDIECCKHHKVSKHLVVHNSLSCWNRWWWKEFSPRRVSMLSKENWVATDFSRYYHDIILTHQSFVITTNFKLPFSPQEHSWFVLTNAVVSRGTCQKRRKVNEVARSVSGKSSDSAKSSLYIPLLKLQFRIPISNLTFR